MPKKIPSTADLVGSLPPPRSRSVLSQMPDLVRLIEEFLHLKAEEDPRAHVTLKWYYENKLKPLFAKAPSFDSVRRYVGSTLNLDVTTGRKRGE